MAHVHIETRVAKIDLDLTPSADFITCLIPALIAAVPAFLSSFMQCISGGGTTGDYHPGDRIRCQ